MFVRRTSLRNPGWSAMPSTPVPRACTHFRFFAFSNTWLATCGPKVMGTSAAPMQGSTFVWWSTMSTLTSGKWSFTWLKYCIRTASGRVSTMSTFVISGRSGHRHGRELGHHSLSEQLRRLKRLFEGEVAEGEAREDVVDAALRRLAGDCVAHGLRRSGDRLPARHDSVEVLGVGDVRRQRDLAPAPEGREIREPAPIGAAPDLHRLPVGFGDPDVPVHYLD